MYGWTDPTEQDRTQRRTESHPDEPAWLTDRPEPRSSYLFGDEPDQSPEPSGAPTDPRGVAADRPGVAADRPGDPTDPRGVPTDRPAPPARYAGPEAVREPVTALLPVTVVASNETAEPDAGAPVRSQGRHRPPRRFTRPVVIGGAAAAATLVVSLGVGALLLPGDEELPDFTGLAEQSAPALPAQPDTLAGTPTSPPVTASPTPSASASPSPSTASPTPSPARTSKAAPTPDRTTSAPSRRNVERGGTGSGATTRATTAAADSGAVSGQAQQVVDLVNAERSKAGCGAVQIDDKLMTAAQRHSQDQADTRNMSHTGSDGSDVGTRLDRVGYTWRTYGENVAWNQQSPAAVMDAWMNSPGHRANILNCAFTEIGVGIATSNGPYWTQNFAAPR
ncbi:MULTISPECIES: CAP domain-containing protein [Micromonospora]|uniref:Uncharacterized conserved protein YkwD, contains CAP (CSP/antigen 5/PR1) domain n=1 Tax=Micromonospora yangpuensis TaxID=683228 RepID=A0A1C6UBA7_9ACTN|nr:CAP domain-containing protein [Micromonospora yangpuensis]SCL51365.1 Uncharacterized conserved protein YkwD, contains CAP (CSP/antigen 5/PR1) domain [Micromonospora yangpuensis]